MVPTSGKVRYYVQPKLYTINLYTCNYTVVYQKRGYIDIVGIAAERSMRAAIDEVKHLPAYSTKGEVLDIAQSICC